MAAVPEDKSGTGPQANDLPSTAASNRFTGRVAIVTGGASGKTREFRSPSLKHIAIIHLFRYRNWFGYSEKTGF